METLNIFHSEETSEVNNQTSNRNNISKAIQNILNDKKAINQSYNNDDDKVNEKSSKKNYLLNKINSKKSQTKSVEKEKNNFHKTSPYTFKYFYKTKNGRHFHNSSSLKNKNFIKSNFINLTKDANIYTSNADYIKNKKIILFDEDKSNKDNKESKDLPKQMINKKFTLYKTTMFRGGKLIGDKNEEKEKETINKKSDKSMRYYKINKKNKFHNKFKDMPIDNMINFIEQNKENLFPKKKIIIDYDSLKKEKFIPHYSLYEQIMFKKDKIFDDLKKNINNENNNNSSKRISYNNSSYFNYNHNNSTINNSFDANCSLNNSDISKNINNLSGYSKLLSKKGKDGIPIIFPIIYSSSFGKFNSNSQSSRYQTIMDNFMKLKTLIDNEKSFGKNNEFDYIKEFLINKKIDKQYINSNNITNFSNFLNYENLPIDLDKSLKENILLALNFNKEKKMKIKNKRLFSPIFNKNKFYRSKSSFFNDIKNNNYNNENSSSLILDLSKQKKLFKKDEEKNDNILKKELKEEINMIEEEIKNKQEKINDVEKNLNLIPFYNNYYKKKKINNKRNESIELRLASMKEINKSKLMKNDDEEKGKKKSSNLFDANERLYYTWYRGIKKGDIKNFMKKTKLTEFIMFNKTREKLLYNKIDEIISNI